MGTTDVFQASSHNPLGRRAGVLEENGALRITIPARWTWRLPLDCLLTVAGVIVSISLGLSFIRSLFGPEPMEFMLAIAIVPLTAYTWFSAVVSWWGLRGGDVLSVEGELLIAEKPLLGYRYRRVFSRDEIRNLHASTHLADARGLLSFNNPLEDAGLSGGRIAFDYQRRTYRFGTGVTYEEAEDLVWLLQRYLGQGVLAELGPAEVTARRASVRDLGDVLEVSIPGWYQRASRVAFAAWFVFWNPALFLIYAERTAMALTNPFPADLVPSVMFAAVAVAAGYVGYLLLWEAFGTEGARVDAESFVLFRRIGPYRRTRRFRTPEVTDLHVWHEVVERPEFWRRVVTGNYLAYGGGHITFRCGGQRHAFGVGLGHAEAQELVHVLHRRFLPAPADATR